MPYYIRLFTPSRENPALEGIIEQCANSEHRAIRISKKKMEFAVFYADDDMDDEENDEIVIIERLPIYSDSEGQAELADFKVEVEDCRPASAAMWLKEYFSTITTIYRFQIFEPSREDWDLIHAIVDSLHRSQGGIIQADLEGFTNEEGVYILWQFSDSVSGQWEMAVLDELGHWVSFEMDLGDVKQRAAFLNGRIPPGAILR